MYMIYWNYYYNYDNKNILFSVFTSEICQYVCTAHMSLWISAEIWVFALKHLYIWHINLHFKVNNDNNDNNNNNCLCWKHQSVSVGPPNTTSFSFSPSSLKLIFCFFPLLDRLCWSTQKQTKLTMKNQHFFIFQLSLVLRI